MAKRGDTPQTNKVASTDARPATFAFTLTGTTPFLMHADDLDAQDELAAHLAKLKAVNQKRGKAGDDRNPAWTWQTYLWKDDRGKVAIPAEVVMRMLRDSGQQLSAGAVKDNLKKLTQIGIHVLSDHCEFLCHGRPVLFADIHKVRELDYHEQADAVRRLGFTLFAKRAQLPKGGKVVRVRPKFDRWQITGKIMVASERISDAAVVSLFQNAGTTCGIGDWRPSAKFAPGHYGMFTAEVVRMS